MPTLHPQSQLGCLVEPSGPLPCDSRTAGQFPGELLPHSSSSSSKLCGVGCCNPFPSCLTSPVVHEQHVLAGFFQTPKESVCSPALFVSLTSVPYLWNPRGSLELEVYHLLLFSLVQIQQVATSCPCKLRIRKVKRNPNKRAQKPQKKFEMRIDGPQDK